MDKHLQQLKSNNPTIEIKEETNHYDISNLWADNAFIFRLEKAADFSSLVHIMFPVELAAIYHKDKSLLEFIFALLPKDYERLPRRFSFYYSGIEFKTYFEKPTDAFKLIAEGFIPTDTSSATEYRNLRMFRDYYKRPSLPEYFKKYFENRIPINFFVEGNFDKINYDYVGFSKHLNFYMHFYDRRTPTILVYEQEHQQDKYKLPCFGNENPFPEIITGKKFDPVILDLFHVARTAANIRLKFIFYFQVLEYCSYYYLNDDLKKRLTNIIKRPDLLNNTSDYSKLIIEEFKDYFKQNDDSIKLEKLILDYCNWEDVKLEIVSNYEYFAKDIEFDGGFKIPSIIKGMDCIENPPKGVMKNIKSNIEKIRNVLVHIRESRENKVILPTKLNNHLLTPYLHLIQRIAENIAIQHE